MPHVSITLLNLFNKTSSGFVELWNQEDIYEDVFIYMMFLFSDCIVSLNHTIIPVYKIYSNGLKKINKKISALYQLLQ